MQSPKYASLLGTPYAKKDCYGIVREFYKLEFGKELKKYYEDGPKEGAEANNLIYSSVGDFRLVEDARFGDILLIKLMGVECHIAVYLGDGLMIHTTKTTGCVIERFAKWKKLVAGIYRVIE